MKNTTGKVLRISSLVLPVIFLMGEMIIYIILYRENNFHNNQMKDSLSKRNLHARYRQKDYSETMQIRRKQITH